jgi:hypothetical protein
MLHTALNTWILTQLFMTHTSTEIKFPQLKMIVDIPGNRAEFLNLYLPNLSVECYR